MRGRSIRTRAKLLPRPDVTHDEPRFGHGRQFSGFQIQIQILIRHFVVDGVHEETAKRLHLADRDPLARTTVVPVVITTALRNEVVGGDLPIVKPLGPELLRRVPRTSVGIRAVEVEQNPVPFGKAISAPLEIALHPCRNRGKERIQTADLLHERFELSLVVLQLLPPLGMPM